MAMTLGPAGTHEAVDLSLTQFAGAWNLWCEAAPGHIIREEAGIHYAYSGCPIPFFNVALLTGRDLSAADLDQQARQATAWFADKPVPWLLVVTHERLQGDTAPAPVLDACGFGEVMPLTGMIAAGVASRPDMPEGLHLIDDPDDDTCASALDVNSAAYAMDLSAGKAFMGARRFWGDHVLVVGRAGEAAVTSTAVLMVDGYRYVALVATDPAYQRRGFADAAMRRALERSASVHGERPTVLHATAAGRPVYERMGYTTIANHTVFMEKRFLEGH